MQTHIPEAYMSFLSDPGTSSLSHKFSESFSDAIEHANRSMKAQPRASMRFKKMTEVVVKEPSLHWNDPKNWVAEILVWVNNAVRKEIADMHYLVSSMHKRTIDLGRSDVEDFYHWFEMFYIFIENFFGMETRVLIPWIKSKMDWNDSLREQKKKIVTDSMDEIIKCHARFENLPPGEVLPALIKSLDRLSPRLVECLTDMERHVPNQILKVTENMTPEEIAVEKAKVIEDIMKHYRKCPQGHVDMRIIFRSMINKEEMEELRNQYTHIKGFKIIANMRLKKQFEKSRADYRTYHSNIVKRSYKKWAEAKVRADEEQKKILEMGSSASTTEEEYEYE